MLYSESYISSLAKIHRRRALPTYGQVRRQVGDMVVSDTLVAEADVPMGYRLLDLAKILGARARDASKVMVKKLGDAVEEGEVIARAGALFKTECVSPVGGKILDARGSKVLIEVTPQHVELMAFYPGEIVNLMPGRGVIIETTGAVIQGKWGTGSQLRARLEPAVEDGKEILQAGAITPTHMGTILIGGRTLDAEAIDQAVRNRARAIVVGSVSSALLSVIESSPLSFILTEGFGDFPMGDSTFELLCSYAGYEVCFSPITETRWQVCRPEIVIPVEAEAQVPAVEHTLTIGTRVRANRAPYENLMGEVADLPPHRRRTESGGQAYGAEVDLGSAGKVFIPFENLECVL